MLDIGLEQGQEDVACSQQAYSNGRHMETSDLTGDHSKEFGFLLGEAMGESRALS